MRWSLPPWKNVCDAYTIAVTHLFFQSKLCLWMCLFWASNISHLEILQLYKECVRAFQWNFFSLVSTASNNCRVIITPTNILSRLLQLCSRSFIGKPLHVLHTVPSFPLAICNVHIFGALKKHMCGCQLASDEEVHTNWINEYTIMVIKFEIINSYFFHLSHFDLNAICIEVIGNYEIS